jgi:outer membrane protein
MHSNIRFPVLVAAATLALAQAPALAQLSQTVKGGLIRYDANSRSNGVTGVGLPPGADAEVGDATTVLLTYEIEVKPNVGIEFVLGIPPKIKGTATGSVAFLGEVLTVRNVSPALVVNYHFGKAGDTVRPYIGLGLNYTHFTNIESRYGWDVEMRDSVGYVAQVGVDYALGQKTGLFASVAKVDTKSKLVATGATVIQTTIDFRPMTYSFGAYYKF